MKRPVPTRRLTHRRLYAAVFDWYERNNDIPWVWEFYLMLRDLGPLDQSTRPPYNTLLNMWDLAAREQKKRPAPPIYVLQHHVDYEGGGVIAHFTTFKRGLAYARQVVDAWNVPGHRVYAETINGDVATFTVADETIALAPATRVDPRTFGED